MYLFFLYLVWAKLLKENVWFWMQIVSDGLSAFLNQITAWHFQVKVKLS